MFGRCIEWVWGIGIYKIIWFSKKIFNVIKSGFVIKRVIKFKGWGNYVYVGVGFLFWNWEEVLVGVV